MTSPPLTGWRRWLAQFLASLTFYTCLPIPATWWFAPEGIARFAPLVGLVLGSLLACVALGLHLVGMPTLTSSVVIMVLWIALTGGLHLDGVMDTADGLAVTDPDRRLAVMADSTTGAFGVMAGVSVMILKVAALADLITPWGQGSMVPDYVPEYIIVLIVTPGWGRWAQQLAILRYPYLRDQGKGAIHKTAIRSGGDMYPGTLLLLGMTIAHYIAYPERGLWVLALPALASTIALLTGLWIQRQLSGHTGDTYGAVVEWTEALTLCGLTIFM